MKTRPLPSKEELDQIFRYDPMTGEIFWRPRTAAMFTAGATAKRPREHACNQWNSRWLGRSAASLKSDGYWYTHFNYRTLLVHRIAWKIMTGEDPVEVDHIDGNRSNNKWTNLKNGTRSENQRNTALKSNNKSGHHGVRFSTRQQKWTAIINVGSFDSKEEAVAERKKVETALGYSSGHGREIVASAIPAGRNVSFNSKSGVPGVTWDNERDCWQAWISVNGKQNFLGRFMNKDAAIEARKTAEEEYSLNGATP